MGRLPAYIVTGHYRKSQLKTLSPRHTRIIEMLLLGVPPKEVAARMGVSTWTVSIVANCPQGRALIEAGEKMMQEAWLDSWIASLGHNDSEKQSH